MPLTLRLALIAFALLTGLFMLVRIRQNRLGIPHSIFWLTFSLGLIAIALFPQIAMAASALLGIESPANFVFLSILFVLIIKLFHLTLHASALEQKLIRLAQHIALNEDAE